MDRVLIATLIYRSTSYADSTYETVHRYTRDLLDSGRAEFTFVANDPWPCVQRHLREHGYQHIINRNQPMDEDGLAAIGCCGPMYLHRAYCGWNRCLREAMARDCWGVVQLGSDYKLSPGWLEALLEASDEHTLPASQLVERPGLPYGVFPGAIVADFGESPETFSDEDWVPFAAAMAKSGTKDGGCFSPALIRTSWIKDAGWYPEGNIPGKSGDRSYFERISATCGVRHVTALGSVVYHYNEGEMRA